MPRRVDTHSSTDHRSRWLRAAGLLLALSLGTLGAVAVGSSSADPPGTTTVTFNYTGAEQTWTVPPDVTNIAVTALGGSAYGAGWGSKVTGNIAVTPNQILYIEVGGESQQPSQYNCGETQPCWESLGGWNGGGNAYGSPNGREESSGTGGGGASDVQTQSTGSTRQSAESAISSALIVAGGGGGTGGEAYDASQTHFAGGGYGGYSRPENPTPDGLAGNSLNGGDIGGQGGTGGTDSAGGTGGQPGGTSHAASDTCSNGYCVGGPGASGLPLWGGYSGNIWAGIHDTPGGGGGGGGGFYGGGAGGSGAEAGTDNSIPADAGAGGGGGLGSSLVPSGGALTLGGNYGDGEITFVYGAGVGTTTSTTTGTTATGTTTTATTSTTDTTSTEPPDSICSLVGVVPSQLPSAIHGAGYRVQLTGIGGQAPYTFSAGGPLPPGLQISPTGLLSGTVSAAPGTYPVNVNEVDARDCSGSNQAFTVSPTGALILLLKVTAPPVRPAGRLRVSGSQVTVPLSCVATCAGTVTETVTETRGGNALLTASADRTATATKQVVVIASRTFAIKAHHKASYTLSLNAAGRRLLSRLHILRTHISLSVKVAGRGAVSLADGSATLRR